MTRQVEDLHALGEWAYIATDACIFKTLDEDQNPDETTGNMW